jgi:hypothetical protein
MIKIYSNSIYFIQIINALEIIFIKYNKTVEESKQIKWEIVNKIKLNSNHIYLLFNPYSMKEMPKKYIIYNFEQLQVDIGPDISNFSSDIWIKLENAIEVWDYSKTNIEYLQTTHNINNIKFFPLGWSVAFKNKIQSNSWNLKTNTFMFIGLMNEYRRDFIKPIHSKAKEKNWNMYLSNKCWNHEYEEICSISKIALNIHYYSGKTILEIHRIIPLILNDIWVLSERSYDSWYDELFTDIVDWVDNGIDTSKKIDEILLLDEKIVKEELNKRKRLLISRCDYWSNFTSNNIIEKLII